MKRYANIHMTVYIKITKLAMTDFCNSKSLQCFQNFSPKDDGVSSSSQPRIRTEISDETFIKGFQRMKAVAVFP